MPTKPTNTIQKLRTVNTKKRVNSPIRSKSNTKQNKDVQLKAQIKQLKEELEVLLKITIKLKQQKTQIHLHQPKLPSKI